MQCKNCGANLADNSVFCSQCGTPLYGEQRTPQNITVVPQLPIPESPSTPSTLTSSNVPMVQGTPSVPSSQNVAPTSAAPTLSSAPTTAPMVQGTPSVPSTPNVAPTSAAPTLSSVPTTAAKAVNEAPHRSLPTAKLAHHSTHGHHLPFHLSRRAFILSLLGIGATGAVATGAVLLSHSASPSSSSS